MAKSLLLNVLADVLGSYVEGLTRENLKLGVWSGKIEFSNLLLKESALDQLDLPIRVMKGSLNNLRVKVPWTALESRPVEVFIDGVYLLAAPQDFSKLSPEDAKRMIFATIRAKLKQVEDGVLLALKNQESKEGNTAQKTSYVQQLVTRIVDNLEVTITNLHVRYEDSYADPANGTFSCGITLEQILLTTTDETWTAKFVKRDLANKVSSAVHKLGTVQNATVYWNVSSESYVNSDNSGWKEFMHRAIYRNDSSSNSNFVYLLKPPNNLQVKIIHRELCNETTPNVDVIVESSLISFFISQTQYRQLMLLINSFTELDRKKQVSSYRPSQRPTDDPRGWWHYAFMLVVGKDRSFAAKMQTLSLCAKSRVKYTSIVRQKIINAVLHDQDGKAEEEKLRGFDETLPLSALVIFREAAAKEAALEIQRIRQANAAKLKADAQNSTVGYLSSWFTSKPQPAGSASASKFSEDEEDKQLMSELEANFNCLNAQAESAINQAFSFRGRVITSSVLSLSNDKTIFTELSLGLNFSMETRFSNMFMLISMNQLAIHDLYTDNPYNADLLSFDSSSFGVGSNIGSPKSVQSSPKQLELLCQVDISVKPEAVNVKYRSKPVIITWNDQCIKQIITFILNGNVGSHLNVTTGSRVHSSLESFGTQLPGTDVHIAIDLDAPKIIIPELRGSEHCILVDMGKLSVQGAIKGSNMAWDVHLSHINIAMPMERPNLGFLVDQQVVGYYLIQPFDVELYVKAQPDNLEADTIVSVQVHPSINGYLDAEKISRLMKAIFVILDSIALGETKKSAKAAISPISLQPVPMQPQRRKGLYVKQLSTIKDDSKPAVKVVVALELAMITLNIEDRHNATLSFESFSLQVLQHKHDVCVSFTLKTIELQDSLRPQQFSSVISCQTNDVRDLPNLIQGNFTSISHPSSRYYTEYQQEFTMKVAGINIYVDALSTATYQVLANKLMTSIRKYKVFENSPQQSDSVTGPTSLEEYNLTLGGMKLEFSLDQVIVNVLAFDPTTKGVKSDLNFFEEAYSLQLSELSIINIMRDRNMLRGHLKTIEVVDVRKKSSSYCYRQLVGDEFHRISGETEGVLISPMIELEMHEEEDRSNNLQLTVRSVTLMITVEVVMHMIDVIMSNVNSVMAVLGEIIGDREESTAMRIEAGDLLSSSQRRFSLYQDNTPKSSKMVLLVSVIEPRLMMLEDVRNKHTKAIVNRSNVFVQFTTTTVGDDQTNDVHVSLHNSEIFVVTDVVGFKRYHQLLKPMGFNFHMRSEVVGKKPLLMDFTVSVESVKFRASLNDIVLIVAIVQGQEFGQEENFDEAIENDSIINLSERRGSVYQSESDPVIVYKVKSLISHFEVVLINDYHGQNIPCFRLNARDADFLAEGVTGNFEGKGRVLLNASYYNLPLAVWEPLLEDWCPKLEVLHDFNGLQLKANCDDPMQINITGELCKAIVNAVELMQNIGVEEAVAPTSNRFPLTIVNQLGIPVEIQDSRNDKPLAELFDYNVSVELTSLPAGESSSPIIEGALAGTDSFNLRLLGDLGNQFEELRHLPHSFKKTKLYQLKPKQAQEKNRIYAMAPIIEETYQYSRYKPVKMRWEAPWTNMNDPPEWSDASWKIQRDPRSIPLPAGWRWVEPEWKVDTSGTSSKETDEEGWEYALNFNSFGLNTRRRNKQPTDCVRRRRWIRARLFNESQANESSALASVGQIVWKVHLHDDETKEISIMTTKQVVNYLPFTMELGIEVDGGIVYVIDMQSNQAFSIPLVHCTGRTVIRVRPSGFLSDWSEQLVLASSSLEATVKRICCRVEGNVIVNILWQIDNQKILRGTLSAPIDLCNRLPCKVKWTIQPVDKSSPTEKFDINAGSNAHVLCTNYCTDVQVQLTVGHYESIFSLGGSAPDCEYRDIKVSFQNMHNDQAKPMILTLRMTSSRSGTLQFTIFADCLVVDKRFMPIRGAPNDNSENLPEHWTELGSGLSLVEARDGKISFPTFDTKSTLESVQIESLSGTKSNVELSDLLFKTKHSLCLKMERFNVAPDLSKVITVMHSYHIVNCMNRTIFLYQKNGGKGSRKEFPVLPRNCTPFNVQSESGDTSLLLGCEGCQVSYGCFDINAIGTSVLFLASLSDANTDFVAANVEVRFSQPDEPSYITVIIWEAKIVREPRTGLYHAKSAINLLIRNDLELPISFRQAGVDFTKLKGNLSKFSVVVQPGERKPFAWIDPDIGLSVDVFLYMYSDLKPVLTVDATQVGKDAVLRAPDGIKLGKVKVKAYSSGTVISFVPLNSSNASERSAVISPTTPGSRGNDLQIKLLCELIGISVVAERPSRREILTAHFSQFDFSFYQLMPSHPGETPATIIEFSIGDIQVDNYSESAVYPVLLQQTKQSKKSSDKNSEGLEGRKAEGSAGGASFLQFSLALEQPPDQNTSIMKYVAFRLLEAQVQIDSASILILVSDLIKDMMNLHSNLQLEDYSLELKAQNFNNTAAAPLSLSTLYDLDKQYKLSYGNKMFYENIVIHPIKLVVSFYPSPFPRSAKEIPPGMKWMLVVEKVTAFEDMAVKVKSFIAKNALESPDSLSTRILNKVVRDMQSNLLGLAGNIIGSMSILGKPAGLYKNIGGGVQDFFYEPYTGLMESPLSFAKGMTKGTGSLLKGVTTGVVSSTANVVGTATGGVNSLAKGVAAFSGDEKYIKMREDKKREFSTTRGGIFSGFKAGTESVVSGFTSGITGLVTKPLEQGQKEGAFGFIKGVGQGIVGVAVKPVMGVTEGISNVAMGINNQFSESTVGEHVRPPRAMVRRDVEDADIVLNPLDLFSARAQAILNKRASTKNYKDIFLTAFALGFSYSKVLDKQPFGVAVSTKIFAVLNRNCEMLWSLPVPSISHMKLVKVHDRYALEIVEYEQKSQDQKILYGADRYNSVIAYNEIYRFRTIFGNPSAMLTAEESLLHIQAFSPDSSSSESQGSGHVSRSPAALANIRKQASVQTYRFGSANNSSVSPTRMNEQTILNRTAGKLTNMTVKAPISASDQIFVYHKVLDEVSWELVNNWTYNHDKILNPSRCLALILVNHSNTPVQITDVNLKEGANYTIFSVAHGYNQQSKTLQPAGGAALLFAYGKRPSLISKEHVKVDITTSAFTSMMSTRENRSDCTPIAGYSPSFLEKTRTDWWAKYAISIL